jgi:broad-specificity NMP kinase
MRRVLVTGMTGTGKSSVLAELARLGHRVVDTDDPGWTEWSEEDDGYVWREDRIESLLAEGGEGSLYVSGCVSNQGRFYDRFDAVVLLSAPPGVLLRRIEDRTTNDYGKSDVERARVLADLETFEPRLRATCTYELDATRPLEQVVAALLEV